MAFAYPTARPGFAPAAGLILALAGLTPAPAAGQTEIAFTQTFTGFPGSSFDEINVGEPGSFASLSLPSGLEFPFDIDFNAATNRFFVIGAGSDNGTEPPSRGFDDQQGSLWSFSRDGSDPIQHVSGLNRPQFFDVSNDGQTVFVGEQGTGSGSTFQDNGRILRLDVPGNTIQTLITAPAAAGPTGVHFDEATDTVFYQVNKRGDTPDFDPQQIRRVTNATTATNLAAGSDDLFLANKPADGTLDDAAEVNVVSAGRNVQVVGDFLYWHFRNGSVFNPPSEIRRIALDFDLDTEDPATSFETIVTGDRIVDFEVFGDEIFWTDVSFSEDGVFRANLDGTDQTLLAQGTAFESLPTGVTVVPDMLPGDLNNDGVVDGLDIDPFVQALTGGEFDAAADLNGDDKVDGLDIDPFVQALTGGQDAAMPIPEPGSAALLILTAMGLGVRRRTNRPGR